ncbi:hypothetical protein BDW_13945 [Bdellovibrio bacteriovorus W]|nr:hypothetical protein BDW_13945 [Bdellovibrio bacteriovorus W]
MIKQAQIVTDELIQVMNVGKKAGISKRSLCFIIMSNAALYLIDVDRDSFLNAVAGTRQAVKRMGMAGPKDFKGPIAYSDQQYIAVAVAIRNAVNMSISKGASRQLFFDLTFRVFAPDFLYDSPKWFNQYIKRLL